MTRPDVATTAEYLYDEVSVAQPHDEQLGWPFLILLAGMSASLGQLADIVRDTDDDPGWSALLDPDRCPAWALPWLAQFAGVKLTTGLTDEQHRDEIASPAALQRGTVGAIKRAGAVHLTGSKRVKVVERDGNPLTIGVTTYAGQTIDGALAYAAIEAQTPAWLALNYTVAPGWSVAEFEAAYAGQTVTDAEGDFINVFDLEARIPA